MSRLLCILIMFASGIFPLYAAKVAEKADFDTSPRLTTLNCNTIPSLSVHGVNVTSGHFSHAETDFALPGPEPLALHRTYAYCHTYARFGSGALWDNWTCNLANYFIAVEGYITNPQDNDDHYHYYGRYFDDHWSELYFGKGDVPSRSRYFFGAVNGGFSGRTHPKNSVVKYGKKMSEIREGDGSRRVFLNDAHTSGAFFAGNPFHISRHERPSGNIICYDFSDRNTLLPRKVEIYDASQKKAMGWISFSCKDPDYKHTHPKGSWQLDAKASNGRWAKYCYEWIPNGHDKYRLHLLKAETSEKEPVEYLYNDDHDLKEIRRPDKRSTVIDYKKEKDKSSRVVKISERVGSNDKLLPIATFEYHKKNPSQKHGEGHTLVLDAKKNKAIYRYDLYQRLTVLERYSKKDTLHHKERYAWGNVNTQQAGNLLAKVILPPKGKPQAAWSYTYDERGNVLSETLWGALTGKHCQPIALDKEGIPVENGSERYSIRYTYSTDGFNLMLSKTEDNGRSVHFSYLPGTDRLKAKYLFDKKAQKLRTFYTYDSYGNVVKIVEDDGLSQEESDLKGVTERHITLISPSEETSSFGLPLAIEEFIYNPQKKKSYLISKKGYLYNQEGRVSKEILYDIHKVEQYSLCKSYDTKGRLIKEIDSLKRTWEYQYDKNGNLTSKSGPTGDVVTTYEYDFANRLIKETEAHTDGSTYVKRNTYDPNSNLLSTTDWMGAVTKREYDSLNRLVKVTHPAVPDEQGNLKSPIETFAYDLLGNRTQETEARGYTTKTFYNVRGQPVKIEHPDGTCEIFEYNLDGTLAKKQAVTGALTYYTYDYLGRVIKTELKDPKGKTLKKTLAEYDAFHLLSETDEEGLVTTYTYHANGLLHKAMKGDSQTEATYDALCRPYSLKKKVKGNLFVIEIKERDVLGRVIQERHEDLKGNALSRVDYAYDLHGNVVKKTIYTHAGAGVTTTAYDTHRQPVKIIDPVGGVTQITYDYAFKNARKEKVLCKTTYDPNGNITEEIFDPLSRVEVVNRKNVHGKLIDKKTFSYDLTGNKTLETHDVFEGVKFKETLQNGWTYDPCGRVQTLVEFAGTPSKRVTAYTYSRGMVETITHADKIILKHDYDLLGRLTRLSSSDQTVSYAYEYDKKDRPVLIHNLLDETQTVRAYDALGCLTSETLQNGLTLKTDYDALQRPVKITFPDQSTASYHYDPLFLGQITRYGKDGELLYSHRYEGRDLSGRPLHCHLIGKAGEVAYSWDKKGRCLKSHHPHFSYSIPKKGGFDPKGRLTKIALKTPLGSFTNEYQYDPLDQLASETGLVGHTYGYNSREDRLAKDSAAYTYDGRKALSQAGPDLYKHNVLGQMTQSTLEGKKINYTYDALGRMSSAKEEGVFWAVYTYDSFHRRTFKKVSHWDGATSSWKPVETWRYLYHGNVEMGAVDTSGQMVELRLLGEGKGAEIGAAVAIELRGKPYAPLYDDRGCVNVLLDLDGNPQEVAHYSAYQEEPLPEGSPTVGNPWRFSSKRFDAETGFIFFGLRYYSPTTGRWTIPDPAGFKDGPNLYAYVHNSPIIYFDAYGLYTHRTNAELMIKYTETASVIKNMDPKSLEKIINCASQNFYSIPLQSGGKELTYGRISYGNGVFNACEETQETLRMLSKLGQGYNIRGVYNDSRGPGALKTVFETLGHKTEAVHDLRTQFCQSFLETAHLREAGNETAHLHLAHSQNTIQTKVALRGMPAELQNYVQVVGLNGGKVVPEKYSSGAINYRSERDPVSLVDPIGLTKYKDNVRVLKADKDAPLFDHSVASPTLRPSIVTHIDKFIEKYK